MPKMVNALFKEHELQCTFPGCGFKQLLDQAESAGWKVGDIVPFSRAHPEIGRCNKCKRHMMKVTKAPEPPLQPGPKGWVNTSTE
jgi:hypothetical protein